ncbi:MAG: hypothetical protein J7K64_04465 [Bacteroidales bacterium]|nr:hypothetical protein [Bacteroidales bacterium]
MEDVFYYSKNKSISLGQGDIFSYLPFFNINSSIVDVIFPGDEEPVYKETDLAEYVPSDSGVLKNVVTDVILKPGIVITQNCDVLRSDYISFCEIGRFDDIETSLNEKTSELNKLLFLTKKYAHQEKYFYLQDDDRFFSDRMAVDFSRIYQIKRTLLEKMINKRIASLGKIPLEHFRVKISNYFKRFAYDGWYMLNKDEFEAFYKYKQEKEKRKNELDLIKPFPWQG